MKFYHSKLLGIENRAVACLLSVLPGYDGKLFGRNGTQNGNRFCYELYIKHGETYFETCLNMFVPHEKFGYGAYDILIDGFENNQYGHIRNIIGNIIDARRAAYIYLEESAGLLSGDDKSELLTASSLYKDMFDILQNVTPYDSLDLYESMSDPKRAELAEALRKCKALEYKAHDIIRKILENWGK